MSALTKGADGYAEYWDGDYDLEYFVEDAALRGIDICSDTRRTHNGKSHSVPAISYSGFYSQGDGLAFDCKINWPAFFEAHPDFKEALPEWYLLLVANPSFVFGGTKRHGRDSNCMEIAIEADTDDVVERGFFEGHDMNELLESIDGLMPLEDYVLDACEREANDMYRTLESSYEQECEYQKEQQVETIIEENAELLARVLARVLLRGATFERKWVNELLYEVEDVDGEEVDVEDLELLGLIEHVGKGVWQVTDKGKELVKCAPNSSPASSCSTEQCAA